MDQDIANLKMDY